ncbi:hypothetical protein LTR78_001373 [Recurvomyces mirabilis]|uniref:Fork-head domain-containing protein n=1 Tax=Recurvomyces mirabilis TaxID=574656 RepID=A0AAE0WVM6_9PEZI|nr:hypothetical protein LTR78_001373 [Recurvomyces mirabilis]KAK5161350.1 hypothetical protein LTS14_001146 [Recurvomyces mirabilis]
MAARLMGPQPDESRYSSAGGHNAFTRRDSISALATSEHGPNDLASSKNDSSLAPTSPPATVSLREILLNGQSSYWNDFDRDFDWNLFPSPSIASSHTFRESSNEAHPPASLQGQQAMESTQTAALPAQGFGPSPLPHNLDSYGLTAMEEYDIRQRMNLYSLQAPGEVPPLETLVPGLSMPPNDAPAFVSAGEREYERVLQAGAAEARNAFDEDDELAEASGDDENVPQASPASTRRREGAEHLAGMMRDYIIQGLQGPAPGTEPEADDLPDNVSDDDQAEGGAALEDRPWTFADGEQDDIEAMGKLQFPDGEYYINTPRIRIGRSHDAFKEYCRRKRRVENLEARAATAMEQYKQEPSQPSHSGDADGQQEPSSNSAQSLEGRPARALPSNYSEHGGIVAYPEEPVEPARAARSERRKRHRLLREQSESSNSIVPANLDASISGDLHRNGGGEIDDWDTLGPFVPIHPPEPDDIAKISKEHAVIEYDCDDEVWKLYVHGLTVHINNLVHSRGEVVVLNHLDRINIVKLDIVFMLPMDDPDPSSPGPASGVFADGPETSEIGTSPVRHLSNAFDHGGDEEDEQAPTSTKKRPTIKLTGLKKAKKAGAKDKAPEDNAAKDPRSPETSKKPDKGKKRKDSDNKAAPIEPLIDPELKEEQDKDDKPSKQPRPSPPPIDLKGTGLEDLAPEELPQRRSGPGRPPANGRVSKRDVASIARKRKDLEKAGLPVPPYNVLLDTVRIETKMRDAQNKAQAKGQPMPADIAMQSIESETNTMPMSRPIPTPAITGEASTSAVPVDLTKEAPPKPSRTARSLSPLPPLEQFTPEQLQKPGITCQVQLNTCLLAIGPSELPQIYHEMQKRFPYYRTTGTNGWQSSVRHNLQQFERFRAEGKNGKGKIWSIDESVPIDKERGKKRRSPQPPKTQQMHQQHMQNGQWVPGQPAYPHQGQPAYPGGPYPSPYNQGQAPPGYGTPGMQYQHPQNGTQQQPHIHQPSGRAQEQQPGPSGSFSDIVAEVMFFRNEYISSFQPGTDVHKRAEEVFTRMCDIESNRFHGSNEEREPKDEAERYVQGRLKRIFERADEKAKTATPAAGSQAPTPAPTTAPMQADAVQPHQQQQPPQTPQQQSANAPPEHANGGNATAPAPVATRPAPSIPPSNGAIPQGVSQAQVPLQNAPTPASASGVSLGNGSTAYPASAHLPRPAYPIPPQQPPAWPPAPNAPPTNAPPPAPAAQSSQYPPYPPYQHPIPSAPASYGRPAAPGITQPQAQSHGTAMATPTSTALNPSTSIPCPTSTTPLSNGYPASIPATNVSTGNVPPATLAAAPPMSQSFSHPAQSHTPAASANGGAPAPADAEMAQVAASANPAVPSESSAPATGDAATPSPVQTKTSGVKRAAEDVIHGQEPETKRAKEQSNVAAGGSA